MSNKAPIGIRIPFCIITLLAIGFVLGTVVLEGEVFYISRPTKMKDVFWIDASNGADFWISLSIFLPGFSAVVAQLV